MIEAVSTHLFVIGGSPVPALVLGCLAAVNEVNMVSYWLGHADINTTHAYVEIDMEMKRRMLEKAPSPAVNRAAP